jgi:hypothetical protein
MKNLKKRDLIKLWKNKKEIKKDQLELYAMENLLASEIELD